jgi:hypothetical protein
MLVLEKWAHREKRENRFQGLVPIRPLKMQRAARSQHSPAFVETRPKRALPIHGPELAVLGPQERFGGIFADNVRRVENNKVKAAIFEREGGEVCAYVRADLPIRTDRDRAFGQNAAVNKHRIGVVFVHPKMTAAAGSIEDQHLVGLSVCMR